MRIRVKKASTFGHKRIDSMGGIDSVIVKESFIDPDKEDVSIYFKGDSASGILNFSGREIMSLMDSLKNAIGLIKKKDLEKQGKKK